MTDRAAETGPVELRMRGVPGDGRPVRAVRRRGARAAFALDPRTRDSPRADPPASNAGRRVGIGVRAPEIRPMAFRFLPDFACDDERRTRPAQSARAGDAD